MDEYIKKEDALNIVKSLVDCDYDVHSAICDACNSIKSIPAENSIIKCENCKWSRMVEYIYFSCLTCENSRGLNRTVAINDYCSYGERAEK